MTRILIIDDDDLLRRMLRLTLLKQNFDVVDAANGRIAMRLHQEIPADLVLTDLVMPEQDGLETIQELRRKHPAVKIIAMSGGGRISAREFLGVAKLMGAHRTLLKPFSNQELTEAVAELLGVRAVGG